MRNILVTGGAGFIGSNFIQYWINNYPDDRVVNLDLLTYAGNLNNLSEIEKCSNYRFVYGDICDKETVNDIFTNEEIDVVVNFAAESHVDRSITGPDTFVRTNVFGTFTLLDIAKQHWNDDKNVRFLHVSTDEVYGTLEIADDPFCEQHNYAPNSPYSASKASSDHFVRAYYHTYGMPVLTTNCSNNYGPYQFPEKLIPLTIINAMEGNKIPIYGDGKNVRDWLHVTDHCRGIEAVLLNGKPGETYNIGGNNEWTNIDIVTLICEKLDEIQNNDCKRTELIAYVKDRPGHDRRYAIDASKIINELAWVPEYTFETGIEETIDWYLKHQSWYENIRDGNYLKYYRQQYGDIG